MEVCGFTEASVEAMEQAVEEEIQSSLAKAMAVSRPDPKTSRMAAYAEAAPPTVKPYRAPSVKNGEAVGRALDYLLENNPQAFLFGLDVGQYGSAFKTCKGLFDRHGAERVMDMPICESAQVGFAIGASQIDARPILEFQFARLLDRGWLAVGNERRHVVFSRGPAGPRSCSGCLAAAG